MVSIHPLSDRSFALLELVILQGMRELGDFNRFFEEEISEDKDIKGIYILERIAAITSPAFLKKTFDGIKNFLNINPKPLPVDTKKLCSYFYDRLFIKFLDNGWASSVSNTSGESKQDAYGDGWASSISKHDDGYASLTSNEFKYSLDFFGFNNTQSVASKEKSMPSFRFIFIILL